MMISFDKALTWSLILSYHSDMGKTKGDMKMKWTKRKIGILGAIQSGKPNAKHTLQPAAPRRPAIFPQASLSPHL
jgi:hypothetical protein